MCVCACARAVCERGNGTRSVLESAALTQNADDHSALGTDPSIVLLELAGDARCYSLLDWQPFPVERRNLLQDLWLVMSSRAQGCCCNCA